MLNTPKQRGVKTIKRMIFVVVGQKKTVVSLKVTKKR